MPRTLLLLLAALLMAAPAHAQVGAATISIEGLPTAPVTVRNETSTSIPFQVNLQVDAGACLGASGTYTVALDAEQASGPNVTVEVSPAEMTFTVDRVESATGDVSRSQGATLVVTGGVVAQPTNVTVVVTGTLGGGCGPLAGASGDAEGTANVHFVPVSALTQTSTEEPVPGIGLPLLVAALAGLVLLRRKA